MNINVDDIISIGEKLYREINPESKTDVPSIFYECLESVWKEWIESGPNKLSFYEFCKTKPRYANTFKVLPEDFRKVAATLLKEADTDTVLRIMLEEFDIDALFNKNEFVYQITPEDARNLGLDKPEENDN